MDIRDEHALQIIKNVYGGSIKLVSGAKALRYSLRHKEGFLALVNDVNGEIRNSYRLMQLNKICLKYEIALIYSDKLTYNNGWLSGFFDACGDLNIQLGPQVIPGRIRSSREDTSEERLMDNKPQLIVSLAHKDYNLVVIYKDIFGGNINADHNGRYVWSINSLEAKYQVLNFLEYIKKHTLRSCRHKRFFLVPNFFYLEDLNAAHAPLHSKLSKAWSIFNNKFNRYIHTTSVSYQALDKYNHSRYLIVWGSFMGSGVGSGRLTREVAEMYMFTNYQFSVVVGILLSDGWVIMCKGAVNPRLGFKQSLDKSSYVWDVFLTLSPFCQSLPNYLLNKRNKNTYHSFNFFTRSLPCLKELYSLFYCENKKVIPANIYNLLSPVALAHWIQGDGQRKRSGLVICTDSYTLQDVVRLVNVLIIRYNLICTLIETNPGQYRIYIWQRSMGDLIRIVLPHFNKSMLYKLNYVS